MIWRLPVCGQAGDCRLCGQATDFLSEHQDDQEIVSFPSLDRAYLGRIMTVDERFDLATSDLVSRAPDALHNEVVRSVLGFNSRPPPKKAVVLFLFSTRIAYFANTRPTVYEQEQRCPVILYC